MQSPKFPLKRLDIEEIINPARLKSRWKEKVRDAMRHQPIPDVVEHLDFHVRRDAACAAIAAEVCSGAYIPQSPIRLLSEKSKGLCRQLVIPSVKDALVLQTLSDALWAELQAKAPSKNAFYAPSDNKFSLMVQGRTNEYGSLRAWLAFQNTIFGYTRNRNYIVVTDIANYYDFISYDHLRNILAGLSVAKEHSLDLLIYTLSQMLWQPDYMPRVQVGLPQINLDAPRLLAHCFLFEIDNWITSKKNVDFARCMDDMDIGVDTVAEAKSVLRDLDLALQTRQIRLNSGKTMILTAKAAQRHFRIRENAFLNRLAYSTEKKLRQGELIEREQTFITRSISRGLQTGAFETGNGEKILKRLINYARKYRTQIDDIAFLRILLKWPSCRETVLNWWQHSERPIVRLAQIRDFLGSAEIVDDEALVLVANALVAARLPATAPVRRTIVEIAARFDLRNGCWGLYAKIWLLSKYGSAKELIHLVEATASVWGPEEQLSRLIAGIYPRVVGSAYSKKFIALIRRAGNHWSESVLDFHRSLNETPRGFAAVSSFLRAPNPSQPNKISHAKFLMLCSVLRNTEIEDTAKADLRARHSFALSDPYYRHLVPIPRRLRRVA